MLVEGWCGLSSGRFVDVQLLRTLVGQDSSMSLRLKVERANKLRVGGSSSVALHMTRCLSCARAAISYSRG